MLELVKLELKKYPFKRYLLNAAVACLLITALVLLIQCSPTLTGEEIFTDGGQLLGASEKMFRLTFLIFQSVLLGKIVVGEYRRRTVLSLYSYPIRRRKIISAKLLLILSFTYLAFVIGSLIANSLSLVLLRNTPLLAGQDLWLLWRQAAVLNALSALITGIIGLVPLFFGMLKKSSTVTIVAGLLSALLLNSDGIGSGAPLGDILAVNLVMILLGLAAACLVLYRVENEDVLV